MIAPNKWQLIPNFAPDAWLVELVGQFAAQILAQRGIDTPAAVAAFLQPEIYVPASADAFGIEMEKAIARIKQAFLNKEKVAIWGDFDADGITATAVLWEGLGEFFAQDRDLVYYIPDRFSESHGLSRKGIETLKDCQLIITCDTGSTSLKEIIYAKDLGIDIIVTDHHTLPSDRPPVIAIINPRYLANDHPLYHLSGVAVAFKLVEAIYAAMPEVPQQPLTNLLDLVAIGLVADLVQLSGDCRYLAQIGIEQLRKKSRLGVKFLLEQCKKSGDRPTDISFGVAPRINAISRIWGDARKCVTLLTSKNAKECQDLVELAGQANTQRKALQNKLFQQVQKLVEAIDLSTTAVIVLADADWQPGILGLVAGQVASEYGRPVILCTLEGDIAKGSARSPSGIDLYSLVKEQEHLLLSFGGHPFAAGLSLKAENLELLREALQQQFWRNYGQIPVPKIKVDLTVEIQDLNMNTFNQLKQLEPFGMGNSTPKFLIRNCRFFDKKNANIKTSKGQKIEYIKTDFTISDRTGEMAGSWWGHYLYELPEQDCDVVVELVDNSYKRSYEVRLIDLRIASVDYDDINKERIGIPYQALTDNSSGNILCDHPPASLQEVQKLIEQSHSQKKSIAIAYAVESQDGHSQWRTLVGIVKYLYRAGKSITIEKIQAKIQIEDPFLWELGWQALLECGWQIEIADDMVSVSKIIDRSDESNWQNLSSVQRFIHALDETRFRQTYFHQILFGSSNLAQIS